jgi:hypothetical protein
MQQRQTSTALLEALRRNLSRGIAWLRQAWTQRWVKAAAAIAVASALLLFIVAEVLANRAQPLLHDRVVAALSAKFQAPVTLDSLTISVLRGLEVEGSGLTIPVASPSHAATTAPPLLRIKSFRFHVPLLDMVDLREHIDTVHIAGLELHVPPNQASATPAAPADTSAVTASVGEVLCSDAHIYFESSTPGAAPLHFDVENLQLKDLSATTAIPYQADIVYAQPAVRMHLSGSFGPWNGTTPGATPLDGSYSTSTVKLDGVAGLNGNLTSSGQFSGRLAVVVAQGKLDSPNLALQESAHPVKMDATYHITVDGITGDTTFDALHVNLPRGQIDAQGKMHILPGEGANAGPDINLDLTVPQGRIEELLEIGTNTRPTLMSGNLTLRSHLHIPPGVGSVEQRFQATGSLAINTIHFGDPKLQQAINSLSSLTQGNLVALTGALRGALPLGGSPAAPVSSSITASFDLDRGMMTVPSLLYTVPGSRVQLHGVYSLGRNAFAFKGHYSPDATSKAAVPQQKAGGLVGSLGALGSLGGKVFRGLAQAAGVQVPVEITGVGSNVKLNISANADESTAQMAAQLK